LRAANFSSFSTLRTRRRRDGQRRPSSLLRRLTLRVTHRRLWFPWPTCGDEARTLRTLSYSASGRMGNPTACAVAHLVETVGDDERADAENGCPCGPGIGDATAEADGRETA
jgi:hypothetical protein